MLLRLLPRNTKIDFLKGHRIAAVLSLVLMIGSVALFAVNSLNYGIDFKGGIAIEIGMEKPIPIAKVRDVLNAQNLGEVAVQEYGSPTEALIRIERQPGGDEAQMAAMDAAKAALSESLADVDYRQENIIGPKVSGELKTDGTIAVTVAVIAVLIYIWFRFEWQFGVGAVIALVHDVLLTVGFFALTRLEFNLSIIAALLTIVGYSLNDTVVVYDRVRENLRKYRKTPLDDVLNLSLNQTLSRTIMTSVTTLLALVSLFLFGGEVIRGFTAAMIWGVVIGTYSSIYVAVPVLTRLNMRRDAFEQDDGENDPTVDKSRPGAADAF
ncbi:protein translocase subunit SecF [Yunchengibacter salinarum]|uniref:protein translocase subunit SecF n=1 Tax=Yunchengibacter salinarum TaxID=3133399 RepID=UPI0035B66159